MSFFGGLEVYQARQKFDKRDGNKTAKQGVAALEAAPNDDKRTHACGQPPRRQAIVKCGRPYPRLASSIAYGLPSSL